MSESKMKPKLRADELNGIGMFKHWKGPKSFRSHTITKKEAKCSWGSQENKPAW